MSKGKRIYIAGPMTGIENYNHAAFNAAAKMLRAEGWIVENPVEIAAQFGTVEELEGNVRQLGRVMNHEIEILRQCDAIYLLHGWEKSEGATTELFHAIEGRKEVILAADYPDYLDQFCMRVREEKDWVEKKRPLDGLECIELEEGYEEHHMKDLCEVRMFNELTEKDGKFRWSEIIEEKMLEASERVSVREWADAGDKFAQVAAEAFRAWKWCMEQDLKKEAAE